MKNQIAKIKKNIKHYAPEILVGATVIAGAAAFAYIITNKDEDEKLLALSNDEWNLLASGDAVTIETDCGPIYIAKEYHTK